MKDASKFSLRAKILLTILSIWALLAAAAFFDLAGPGRHRFLDESVSMSRYEGVLPAPRGTIFSADGIPLCWSERSFDLLLTVAGFQSESCRQKAFPALQRQFPELRWPSAGCNPQSPQVLKAELTPEELERLVKLIGSSPDFAIVPYLRRKVYDHPRIRELAGTVEIRNNTMSGRSGWERQYDQQLAGREGIFSVMLDQHRQWIDGSWQLIAEIVPGQDVHLPDRLAELIAGAP
ncbi:hypothetical protein [Victivallis sp. Marseille-Q1083]|uniref:hypothetical protein n=1 Tax=Victivallis sp. Marseille-Q1083 TaxID=2717288 RepID=UPI00158CBEED|nr:hypothetical protein [Victivallis sp. Marseille-Q1083]